MPARMPLVTALLAGGLLAVFLVVPAEAQRSRGGPPGRPGPGPGGAGPARPPAAGGYHRPAYRPYYRPHYRPYYGSYYGAYWPSYWSVGLGWGWGYDPWFYSPYGPYHPAYYPGGAYATDTGVRLNVEPKDAEVFVNGYFTGTVDDFDGMFQRLSLPPGEYTITLYRQGYRSVTQQVLVRPGTTQRLTYQMVALAPGEAEDPRPVAAAASAPAEPPPQQQWSPPQDQTAPPLPPPAEVPYGQLAIRVQPPDADVTIDGELWRPPAGADRLVVHLPAGTHRVEVRKDGYDPFATDVDIGPGEDTALNVSLRR